MVEKPQILSVEGREQLEKRLEYFTNTRRPEVAERLRLALEDGGELTENTEYEDAKNEQAFVEAEINRITQILRTAKMLDETSAHSSDVVQIGSRVVLLEQATKQEEEYVLVAPAEVNPTQGKISYESPMGKALLDRKVGEKVKVKAPDGDIVFTIKRIL